MKIIIFLILILLIILRIGFFLLIERKLISLIHYRFGPNKVLFIGLLQFLLDLLKLIFKDYIYLYLFNLNYIIYLFIILFFSFFF